MQAAPFHAAMARGPEGGRAVWLRTEDGVRIRLGLWPGPAAAKGTVFLLPGRTEYVEKYGPAAADLGARGYAMLAVDWRGQGLADRPLDDPLKGHVAHFPDFQRDLAAVIATATELDLPRPWFVLGHSMGGAIGLRALMGVHPFSAAAFSAPMWGIGLPALIHPFGPQISRLFDAGAFAERYAPGTGPGTYVLSAPFLDNKLTTDPGMWAFMVGHLGEAPEMALGGPTLHWVTQGILECEALAALASPDLPCLTAIGGAERIIDIPAAKARMARWPQGRLEIIEGAQHELMMEGAATRARFFDAVAETFARG